MGARSHKLPDPVWVARTVRVALSNPVPLARYKVRRDKERQLTYALREIRKAIDEPNEVLLWGANYAASTKGRGLARVGIGSAGSYANLTWVAALRKIQALGNTARLADLPPAELAEKVDPQSISAKSGAIGRPAPKRPRR